VKNNFSFAVFVIFVVIVSSWFQPLASQVPGRENIPYADAKPILETLRSDLIPEPLRALTPAARETEWPEWVGLRDADIRARLAAGHVWYQHE
jgi:hypothetical protein